MQYEVEVEYTYSGRVFVEAENEQEAKVTKTSGMRATPSYYLMGVDRISKSSKQESQIWHRKVPSKN